jgi:hypothetical protein
MAESHRTDPVRRDGSGLRARVRRAHASRLLGAAIVLLGCTAIATAGGAQASQPRMAAGSAWKVEPTPNQNKTSTSINELSAVSCASGRACTAVGSHSASLSSRTFTLAERWNGSHWRIQRTILPKGAESGTLFGVSCASATGCTAVGNAFDKAARRTVNLAEAWNGTSWRVQAIPTPKGSANSVLHGVSCTSRRACTAVGSYDTVGGRGVAVAERWNGTTWRIQAVPKPARSAWFYGVSCSTAHACTADGYYIGPRGARPFAEAWNGRTWHLQAVPLPHGSPGGILVAVSCTSPRACTATGSSFSTTGQTLAERWNGTRWRIQHTVDPADSATSHQEVELNAISCASAMACTATGAYAPGGHSAYFLEAWNGHSWQLVTAPHPAGFVAGALNAVACAHARCTAVGAWSGGPVYAATLAIAS